MAEVSEQIPKNDSGDNTTEPGCAQDMDLEPVNFESVSAAEKPNGVDASNSDEKSTDASIKREREEGIESERDDEVSKKQKSKKTVEERQMEELDKEGAVKEEEKKEGESEEKEEIEVHLGPKKFGSSVEMFDYFFKFLHAWPLNLDINKYEHMVLLDLLRKGHTVAAEKIGTGIRSFQVRFHPMWKSKCFFLVREDGFVDDFSFRKCVDKIVPLPENMKVPTGKKGDGNKSEGHHKGGGGGGGWGGRGGRGGRGRGRGGFRK